MKKIILFLFLITQFTLKIENSSAQWIDMSNGFENDATVQSITAIGSNIFVGRLNYVDPGSVYKSTNNGYNWSNVFIISVLSMAANENRIFAAVFLPLSDLYYSDSTGSNWTGPILQGHNISKVAASGNNIFALGDAVFRSTNNGINWTQIASTSNFSVSCFTISGNNIFAGTYESFIPSYTPGGVYISTNNGNNWTMTSLSYHNIISLALNGNNIFAGTEGNGVYLSTNFGSNWTQTSLNNGKVYSIVTSGNNIFAGTQDSGIYISTNNGTSWIQKNEGFNDSTKWVHSLLVKGNYIYAGAGIKLWRRDLSNILSNNYTVSGTIRYSDNNQPATNGYVKAFRYDNGTGNINIIDSAIIQSDGSYILNNISQGDLYIGAVPNSSPPADYVPTYYPSAIYWQKATVLNPTGNLTGININVFRMSQATSSNYVNGKVSSAAPIAPLKSANVYAKSGNTFVGFGITVSNGTYYINSLPTGSIKIITDRIGYKSDSTMVNVNNDNLDSVNFYLTKLPIGINPISSNISDKYILYQNYPNPFNPVTNIKYQIANKGYTKLKIYDILGKEIASVVDEKQLPGVYEVTFDGSGLASGIYFYKLITDGYSETKRMVLIK